MRQKFLEKVYQPLRHWFLNDIDKLALDAPDYLAGNIHLAQLRDDSEALPGREPLPAMLNKWRQRFAGRFFLFAGTLSAQQGLPILLQAVAGSTMTVLIVGDGPEQANLQQQARDLRLNKVHFLGALPEEDKVALLGLCCGLLLPSHVGSDGEDISLLEGAMFAKPMISTELPGEMDGDASYDNIARETSLLVPSGDVLALRTAMSRIWDQPELAERLGKFAQARYQTVFRAEMMAKNYVRLYVDVISGDAKAP
ncbi:glycosyltransferase [Undibacterium sp. JH2W]|uniref:glycosyltransferase n=1 Tax=Undibacterium sp. JH2W TaxID=3413037 RepID=UPI003BF4045F